MTLNGANTVADMVQFAMAHHRFTGTGGHPMDLPRPEKPWGGNDMGRPGDELSSPASR